MIRLEIFVFLGIAIGIALTLIVQWGWGKFTAMRERQMIARAREEALKVRIDNAPTEELLEEISTRDDIDRDSGLEHKNGVWVAKTSTSVFRKK